MLFLYFGSNDKHLNMKSRKMNVVRKKMVPQIPVLLLYNFQIQGYIIDGWIDKK